MAKEHKYKDLKILEETCIKFLKAKNIAELKSEGKITVTDFIDNLRIEKAE